MKFHVNGPVEDRYIPALLPVPAVQPSSSSNGELVVHGNPGQYPVPSPRPEAIPPTSAGGYGLEQPSSVSPNQMLPTQYWPTPEHCHPPVCLARYNPMPVPATEYQQYYPQGAMHPAKIGGSTQIVQPSQSVTWGSFYNHYQGPGAA